MSKDPFARKVPQVLGALTILSTRTLAHRALDISESSRLEKIQAAVIISLLVDWKFMEGLLILHPGNFDFYSSLSLSFSSS